MQVFIARGEESSGPYTMDQVRAYLAEGLLRPDDLAYHDGLEGWTPLSEVVGEAPTDAFVEPQPADAPAKPAAAPQRKKKLIMAAAVLGLFVLCGGIAAAWLIKKQADDKAFAEAEKRRANQPKTIITPGARPGPVTLPKPPDANATLPPDPGTLPVTPPTSPSEPANKPGAVLWEFEMGSEARSPAIGSDGTVYVGSLDNKLYAINGKTGVKLWEFETGNSVSSSPAIGSDGTVYVGSGDKKLYALSGKTGVKLWEFET
jgi:hypothetical protein